MDGEGEQGNTRECSEGAEGGERGRERQDAPAGGRARRERRNSDGIDNGIGDGHGRPRQADVEP